MRTPTPTTVSFFVSSRIIYLFVTCQEIMRFFLITVVLSISAASGADVLVEEDLEKAENFQVNNFTKSENPETEDFGNLENAYAYNFENLTDNLAYLTHNLENSANQTHNLENSANQTNNFTFSTNNSENLTDNLAYPIHNLENSANLTDNFTDSINNSENATDNVAYPVDSIVNPVNPETEDFGNLENADAYNSENPEDNSSGENMENTPEIDEEFEEVDPQTLDKNRIISMECKSGLPSNTNINKYFKTFGCFPVTSDKNLKTCVYCYEQDDFNLALEEREITIAGKSCDLLPDASCFQRPTQKKIFGARLWR